MALTGSHVRAALAAVGAVGGQMTSLDNLAAGANSALAKAPSGLTTAGAAAFLATQAQESAFFRATEEYAKNGRYAPYIGRTFDQLTWKANYASFGAWCHSLGLLSDANQFVNNPKSLADYKWAWLGGVWFFEHNNLWKYANAGNFLAVSQGVNGGNGTIGTSFTPSGYKTRLAMYNAFHALGNALLPSGKAAPATYYYDVAHWFTAAQVKQLQTKIGVTADGKVGVNTLKAIQKAVGVTQDGIIGNATVTALQKLVGVTADGKLGPDTAAAVIKWATPAKAAAKPAKLTVDGLLGPATITRWQQVCGTTADGKITPGNSALVRFQQTFLNAHGITDKNGNKLTVDGSGIYDNTVHATKSSHTQEALQKYWGTTVDGVFSHPSTAVKELQKRLNAAK